MAMGLALRGGLGCALSGFLLVACSSSSGSGGASQGDAAATTGDGTAATTGDGAVATSVDGSEAAAADVAILSSGATAYMSLGPIGGASDAGLCSGSRLTVGTYGFPVTDGATDPSTGALVRVSCSVVATSDAGGPFRLQATIRSMSDGGSTTLTITGQIATGTNPKGISVTIVRSDGTYSDGNCGVIYSQAGEGVAPGFFWGLLECSGLKDASQNRTCNAEGQIELQKCSAS